MPLPRRCAVWRPRRARPVSPLLLPPPVPAQPPWHGGASLPGRLRPDPPRAPPRPAAAGLRQPDAVAPSFLLCACTAAEWVILRRCPPSPLSAAPEERAAAQSQQMMRAARRAGLTAAEAAIFDMIVQGRGTGGPPAEAAWFAEMRAACQRVRDGAESILLSPHCLRRVADAPLARGSQLEEALREALLSKSFVQELWREFWRRTVRPCLTWYNESNGNVRVRPGFRVPDSVCTDRAFRGVRLGQLLQLLNKDTFTRPLAHHDIVWLRLRGWVPGLPGCAMESWELVVRPALQKYYEEHGNLNVPVRYVTRTPEMNTLRLGHIVDKMRKNGRYLQGYDDRLDWLQKLGWTAGPREELWQQRADTLQRFTKQTGRLPDPKRPGEEDLSRWLGLQMSALQRGQLSAEQTARIVDCTAVGPRRAPFLHLDAALALPLPPSASPQGREELQCALQGVLRRGAYLLAHGKRIKERDAKVYRQLIDCAGLARFMDSGACRVRNRARELLQRARGSDGVVEDTYSRWQFTATRFSDEGFLADLDDDTRAAAAAANYAQVGVPHLAFALFAQLTGRESGSSALANYASFRSVREEFSQQLQAETGCTASDAEDLAHRAVRGLSIDVWLRRVGGGLWPKSTETPEEFLALARDRMATLPSRDRPDLGSNSDPQTISEKVSLQMGILLYKRWYNDAPARVKALLQGLPQCAVELLDDAEAARRELLDMRISKQLAEHVAAWSAADPDPTGRKRKTDYFTLLLLSSLYQDLTLGVLEEVAENAGWEVGALTREGVLIRRSGSAPGEPQSAPGELLRAMRDAVLERFGLRVSVERRPWPALLAEEADRCAVLRPQLAAEQRAQAELEREQEELARQSGAPAGTYVVYLSPQEMDAAPAAISM
eukprot:TRINITY_DN70784_c0_g1_i1.p1 TRINITY_DN70784_c0_g1~~TRINITY_DN70784_c0_g1_i1.p1  ORF type:complete len:890 (+),score=200.08 TRINITY_DN70784_c0_g1_i1:79-2748(+)